MIDRFGRWSLLWCLLAEALVCGCRSHSTAGNTHGTSSGPTATERILEQKPLEFPTAPLTAGATVFDFSALAHTGQALKLSDFLHRPTVVYFCAQDRAAPCTALATALRDSWTDLNAQVDMVFGVSSEPSIVHDDFASEQHLPFLMLSDTDNTLHRVFGIQPGTIVSYLIGTDRKILQVFTPPNISAPAVEILNALTASGLKHPPYPM